MDTHGPVLLRPGHIGLADIERVLGKTPNMPDVAAPRASGTLEAHYAPGTPVVLVAPAELDATLARLAASGRTLALLAHGTRRAGFMGTQIVMPPTPHGYAHDLYAALRTADAARADLIVVEAPPSEAQWQGVNDRLRRAAHDSRGVLAALLGD